VEKASKNAIINVSILTTTNHYDRAFFKTVEEIPQNPRLPTEIDPAMMKYAAM
jgi:hypothetical protein